MEYYSLVDVSLAKAFALALAKFILLLFNSNLICSDRFHTVNFTFLNYDQKCDPVIPFPVSSVYCKPIFADSPGYLSIMIPNFLPKKLFEIVHLRAC